MNTGTPLLDDWSVRKVINAVVPVAPRNYLVMEVKSNLVASDRAEVLKRFNYPCYKKVARVVMGEPDKAYKAKVQTKILKDKQEKSDREWHNKKRALAKKREDAKKKKEAEKKKKEDAKKRAEAAAKKKLEDEKKKAEFEVEVEKKEDTKLGVETDGDYTITKIEEGLIEEYNKAHEDKKANVGDRIVAVNNVRGDVEKLKAECEKNQKLKLKILPKEKAEATVEETKDDEPMEEEAEEEDPLDKESEPPKVELTDEEKSVSFAPKGVPDLAPHVLDKFYGKFSTPEKEEGFDDIQFEWLKGDKAKDYLKSWVQKKKLTSRIEDIKPGQHFKDTKASFDKTVGEWKEKLKAWTASGKKPAKKEGDEADEDVDLFSVTDVCDVGEGVPLFSNFSTEDWQLLNLRCEMALLSVSFKKDADDEDRTGIPLDHLAFYYDRYFRMNFSAKQFGLATNEEVLAMCKDTVSVKDGLVVSDLKEDGLDLDTFLKQTEETRRERQRRIDAGDETARLKFLAPQQPKAATEAKKAAPRTEAKNKDQGGKGAASKPDWGKGKDKGADKGKGKDKGKDAKNWGKAQGKW